MSSVILLLGLLLFVTSIAAMEWDSLLAKHKLSPWQADDHLFHLAVDKLQKNPEDEDWEWLEGQLLVPGNKFIAAKILSLASEGMPERFFPLLLNAAIAERDPSANREFVDPCIRRFGHRKVNEYLLDAVEGTDNKQIAGAVAALYWATLPLTFKGSAPNFEIENATPESRDAYLALQDIWQRKRETYLKVFVHNTNVTVRRQIIPSLKLSYEKGSCPTELRPLVRQAISIARNHEDEYIRHRVEVQLGNENLLHPIPQRED